MQTGRDDLRLVSLDWQLNGSKNLQLGASPLITVHLLLPGPIACALISDR